MWRDQTINFDIHWPYTSKIKQFGFEWFLKLRDKQKLGNLGTQLQLETYDPFPGNLANLTGIEILETHND